jgi:hypothetical protein
MLDNHSKPYCLGAVYGAIKRPATATNRNHLVMEFREHAWQQQLHHMRLLHGAGAEITERSLPTTPPVAIREMLRQSGHPHQLEPLLLTLCKPVNTAMRQRFAGAQGELTLIEKSLSKEDLATDLQVAHHGQIVQAADGILYPTQDVTTSYEAWLRVEMLDVLATMISEGLVRSLVPEMQLKLMHDCLAITSDKEQHELVRLYAFVTALQAAKSFQPIRGAAGADPQFLEATLSYLKAVTADHSPCSIFIDPCEHMRALNACIEALYLAAVGGHQAGDPSLKTSASYIPVADLVTPLQPSPALQDPAVAAAVAKALQQTCCLLVDREQRMEAAAAAAADKAAKKQQKAAEAAAGKQTADTTSSSSKEGEEKELPPELQEQLDAIPTSFADHWRQYLDAADAGGNLAALGSATAAMAAALLQLLAQQVRVRGQGLVCSCRDATVAGVDGGPNACSWSQQLLMHDGQPSKLAQQTEGLLHSAPCTMTYLIQTPHVDLLAVCVCAVPMCCACWRRPGGGRRQQQQHLAAAPHQPRPAAPSQQPAAAATVRRRHHSGRGGAQPEPCPCPRSSSPRSSRRRAGARGRADGVHGGGVAAGVQRAPPAGGARGGC